MDTITEQRRARERRAIQRLSEQRLLKLFHPISQVRDGECWLFKTKNGDGYGVIQVRDESRKKINLLAHRVSKILLRGEPPFPEAVIDHLCRNRACVNPEHLEWVTDAENKRRRTGFFRNVLCRKGLHEMTDDNIVLTGPRKGRSCMACHKIRRFAHYWKDPVANRAKSAAYYRAKKVMNHG